MRERNSNIEILRIIAMMGVVALHYVNGGIGGVENYAVFPGFIWFFVAGVRGFAIPLVNVFVIISGYFMIKSEKLIFRKPMSLLIITVFYGAVKYFLDLIFLAGTFGLSDFIQSCFPFFFGTAWFIKTYIILYLISPFLNKVLNNITMENYKILLLIQFSIFSLWYSVGLNAPIIDDGYGIINFITLYMIGGYIRLFGNECKMLSFISVNRGFLGYIVCSLLTTIAAVFVNPFGYCYFTNIIGASLLFVAVTTMKVRIIKPVNFLSKYAFDVFFVHGKWIFNLLKIENFITGPVLIPHLLVTLFVSYIVGTIVGFVREFLFKNSVEKVMNKSSFFNKVYKI